MIVCYLLYGLIVYFGFLNVVSNYIFFLFLIIYVNFEIFKSDLDVKVVVVLCMDC